MFLDVERVEAEGGLNDLINDLKILAEKSSTPYFFVLNRKGLGRACRRRVGVSAIGILSYQGSEANFHRMVEIRAECREKYLQMLRKAVVDVGGDWDQVSML